MCLGDVVGLVGPVGLVHLVSLLGLGKPSFKKSAVFLNIVQKAFGPPPLLFEHLSYFAGGVLKRVFEHLI